MTWLHQHILSQVKSILRLQKCAKMQYLHNINMSGMNLNDGTNALTFQIYALLVVIIHAHKDGQWNTDPNSPYDCSNDQTQQDLDKYPHQLPNQDQTVLLPPPSTAVTAVTAVTAGHR